MHACIYNRHSPGGPKADTVGGVAKDEKRGAVDGMGIHPGADVGVFGTHNEFNQMTK